MSVSTNLSEKIVHENILRLEYHYSQLEKKQAEILQILPLLLHAPFDLLFPGKEKDELYGVFGYTPNPEQSTIAFRHFRHLSKVDDVHKKLKNKRRSIEFLYLMGSAGTLAFNHKSDHDIWVGAKEESVNELRPKLDFLERWIRGNFQLEVHFFITVPEQISANIFGSLDKESSGSAQAMLLKDEFFRSMIYLAGKYPTFWETGRGEKSSLFKVPRLKRYMNVLMNKKELRETVNIGTPGEISQKELFGTMLWQILKGIHSPFKSALKIALLEYYISDPHSSLLSRAQLDILSKQQTPLLFDPYLFMVQTIRSFKAQGAVQNPQNRKEMRLIERCFLVKCLTGVEPNVHSRKWRKLNEIAREWGYSSEEIQKMHHFQSWSHQDKEAMSRQILSYYIDAYKRLREHALEFEGAISERDLTILGKTLRSYLQKEEGKIPFEFSVDDDQNIHLLRFQEERNTRNETMWAVYATFANESRSTCRLYEHPRLPHVCAWLVLNGYYKQGRKVMFQNSPDYDLKYVHSLLNEMYCFKPDESVLDHITEHWEEKPKALKAMRIHDKQGEFVLVSNSCGEFHLKGVAV